MEGDEDYDTPRITPSPSLLPPFPPSQHSDKVFLEKDSGFRSTSQRKLTSSLAGNQIQPDLQKPTKTPLDVSLETQKVFRSIGIFCHGFLAGLAFWQLIMVFILSDFENTMDFIKLYSPLSQPLHLVFYFLTVICTISILDRYDIARFEWRQLQKLLTFKSGGFAIIIYAFTLIITLVTTKMDDKLSLYRHNETLFESIDEAVSIIYLYADLTNNCNQHFFVFILGLGAWNDNLENSQSLPISGCHFGLVYRFTKA